jgi:hypothetical protein
MIRLYRFGYMPCGFLVEQVRGDVLRHFVVEMWAGVDI